MDPENQGRIKSTVERYGSDDLVVVLGAADLEGLEMVAETVTEGDPSSSVHWQGSSWDSPSYISSRTTCASRSTRPSTTSRSASSSWPSTVTPCKTAMKKLRGEV